MKKILPFLFFISFSLFPPGGATAQAAGGTVTVWVQVMDSCQQGLPGAKFTLVTPNGTIFNSGPSAGIRRVTVGRGHCPLPRGNCQAVPTGCLAWTIGLPTSGIATYHINENPVWNLRDHFYENPPGAVPFTGFVPCNGGSACHSQSAIFTVTPSGVINGRTFNTAPNGTVSQKPGVGIFRGTRADPIVFHNFGVGNGSCDGDHDADDHLTGTPSSSCNTDND